MVKDLKAIEFTALDEPYALDEARPLIGDERALARFAIILGGVFLVWRLYVACISNVIWEESHFVVSGHHLALAYPDIPGGFAWLSRLITLIFGWHVLPLRIVSAAITTAIPWAVYFMATPVVSHRNAIWAAIVATLLPTVSMNGTVYYPEGSLQLLLALMCGSLLRAFKDPDTLKWWFWAGVTAMAGILVHYRFLVPGLAAIAYLALNREGRRLWTRPGIYIVGAIGFLGLVPSLIYNATHGWPAIAFHVVNRVKIDPNPRHVLGLVETQIGITTPVFFAALCAAAYGGLTRDRDKPVAFLAYQSVFIFLFYCLQAIVNKKIMPHWPFMAFVPLLACVPDVLIAFHAKATTLSGRRLRTALIALGPIMSLIIGVAATGYQYLFVHSAEIPYTWRQANIMKNENYSALEPDLAAADARAKQRFGPDVVWATSGHVTAVHLEFPALGKPRQFYTLNEANDEMTRFVVARQDWGLDRDALMKKEAGKGVVLAILDPTYVYHDPDQLPFFEDLCKSFDEIEPFRISSLSPGRNAIDFYTARVRATPLPAVPNGPCPFLPSLYIAHPTRGQFITTHDDGQYFGIAADAKGVKQVDVMIDHRFAAPTRFGLQPKEFPTPDVLKWSPGWPLLQYDFHFPAGSLTPGQHVLTIRATRPDGTTVESDPRILYVTRNKGLASYFEKLGPVVTK